MNHRRGLSSLFNVLTSLLVVKINPEYHTPNHRTRREHKQNRAREFIFTPFLMRFSKKIIGNYQNEKRTGYKESVPYVPK